MSSVTRRDSIDTASVHKKRRLNGASSATATNGSFSSPSHPSATKNSRIVENIKHKYAKSAEDLVLGINSKEPVEDAVSSSHKAESDTASTENGEFHTAEDTPVGPAAEQKEARKSFKDLGVVPELCDACEKLRYKVATPIQAEAIPQMLGGRDVIGLAETGSGKTAAFLLPILQSLLDKNQSFFALIMAPTRELAFQISQAADALGSLINVKTATIVGGMDMVAQSIALGKKPHIVVATPGRLLDHLENTKGFSLRNLKYLILDEADRLLDLDFGPVIDKILKVLPRESRRSALFSATMSSKVESLQRASLSNPIRVSVSRSKYQTVATLLQSWLLLPLKHKDLYLVSLLTQHAGQTAIVFTRTINDCQRLSHLLRALGFSALPLHGQLPQSARLGALGKFRARARDILIATDVAARGLDIPAVDLVLNFDLPGDSETYIHRVGRTARAGRAGKAVSFVTQYDVEVFTRIEHALGRKLPQEADMREEAMVFAERVGEAQRVAVRAMRDEQEKRREKGKGGRRGQKGGGGAGGRRRDEMDRDEG